MTTLEDRFAGCIVGAAVGDALGMPTEEVSPETVVKVYGGPVTEFQTAMKGHPNQHLPAGSYTDDTQQILALSKSLIECNGFDIDNFAKHYKDWYQKISTIPSFDRFSGTASRNAGRNLWKGVSPYESGSTVTLGCGSAMRVAPIGLFYHSNIDEAIAKGQESAVISHNTQQCREGAGIVSGIVAALCQGYEPLDAVKRVLPSVKDNELKGKLVMAVHMQDDVLSRAVQEIGTSALVTDTVGFAVYSFLRAKNFEDAIVLGANATPGDTDSIACIAGAMAGAHYGFGSIPKKFHSVEDFELLQNTAKELLKSSK